MKYNPKIEDAIFKVLREGTRNYGDLKVRVDIELRKTNLGISHSTYAQRLEKLAGKGLISKADGPKNSKLYALTSKGRNLLELGLIGKNSERGRKAFYRIMLFAERENIGLGKKSGFSEDDLTTQLLERNPYLDDPDDVDMVHFNLSYFLKERIIRIVGLANGNPRYSIADERLQKYVDMIWKLFAFQLFYRYIEWEHERGMTRSEYEKLLLFYGKRGAINTADDYKKLRRHKVGLGLPEKARNGKELWREKSSKAIDIIAHLRPRIPERYDNLVELMDEILFDPLPNNICPHNA